MAPSLPDPKKAARAEADRIAAHREHALEAPLTRTLADAPHVDRDSLLAGLTEFHLERMARTPSYTTYPEARPWVEHIRAVDAELQKLAGLTDEQMAVYRSLGHYVTFRGFASARPIMTEKCRVAYLPETDRSEMHIKNVDDPATYWKKRPPAKTAQWSPRSGLVWDGVGSGLHIDDEPDEIFPLPVPTMCHAYCDDVPGAVDFLSRYTPFWGGQNIVLHDAQMRSVAIEKCSYNFIEVFEPTVRGRSHCSGMACRDPKSPQGKYQREKRQQYLKLFNQPDDGPDMSFWNACDTAEHMLAELMMQDRLITADEVFELFVTPFPEGLNKNGFKFHPNQAYIEYTLITHGSLRTDDTVTSFNWQREDDGSLAWPTEPDVCVAHKA